MAIISAGVIMNIILGLACFIYVYLAGKLEAAAEIGVVEPGSPADRAGLQAGSVILQINDNEKPTFEDLTYASALSTAGETRIFMKWRTPGGEVRQGEIIPRRQPHDLRPVIGAGFPFGRRLAKTGLDDRPPAVKGSPAYAAGFKSKDVIIGIKTEGEEAFVPLHRAWDLSRELYRVRGKTAIYQVQRGEATLELKVPPAFFHTLGFQVQMGPVVSLNPDAARIGGNLQVGDLLLAVNGQLFDPLRLPDLINDQAGKEVALTVKRQGSEEAIQLTVTPLPGRGTWNESRPIGPTSPLAIPALGISYTVEPVIVGETAGPAVEAVDLDSGQTFPLQQGDQLLEARLFQDGKQETYNLAEFSWPLVFFALQELEIKKLDLKVRRGGNERWVTLTARPHRASKVLGLGLSGKMEDSWPYPNPGLIREPEMQMVYADGVGGAIALGFRDTHRMIMRIYMFLRRLVTADVSPKLLSGPIFIATAAYSYADRSLPELILFLGMISINLAVVNFLPIPVLDGGHMLFLIIEKIRGKPASERMLATANLIGLVLIAGLMLYVIGLDIRRLFRL